MRRECFTKHFRGKGGFKYAHNNTIMHLNWGWDNVKAVHKTMQMVGSEKFLRTHKKKAAKKGYKINKILTQENIEAFIKSGKDEPNGLVDAIAKAFGIDFEKRMASLKKPMDADRKWDSEEPDIASIADDAFVRRVFDNYPSIDEYEEWGVYPEDKTILEGLKLLELAEKCNLNYRLAHMENCTSAKKYMRIIERLRWIGKLREDMVEHYSEVDMPDKDDNFRPSRINSEGMVVARYPFFWQLRQRCWPYPPQPKTAPPQGEPTYKVNHHEEVDPTPPGVKQV